MCTDYERNTIKSHSSMTGPSLWSHSPKCLFPLHSRLAGFSTQACVLLVIVTL